MNEEIHRSRRNSTHSPFIVNRSRRIHGIIKLVVICVSITVIANLILLSLRSSSLFCGTNIFSEKKKRDYFNCPQLENALRLRPSRVISYFDTPINADFLVQTSNNDLVVHVKHDKNACLNDAEALAAMKAARRFRASGNLKKAQLVMTHAFQLSPKNPDILTEYGIVLETTENNIVEAEGLYRRALFQDPQHTEALMRRARALPLVEEIDNRMMNEINRKKNLFQEISPFDPGLKRAMRESYFQHIYHTVALEGNTMNLVQTRSIVETKLAVAGKSVIEHNEILGMDAALHYLNQRLAHVGEITLHDILAIHKRVLGFADPMAAGVIRITQVYVGGFTPTAPEAIAMEMDELIAWLNDEETQSIDVVELAALAHYKLVYIHPFVDGNGRTSRLLMNYILMQAGFPPVIINVADRLRYYSALQRANEGDLRPFIRFIAEETDHTLEKFITSASMTCEACTTKINDETMKRKESDNWTAAEPLLQPVITLP